MPHHWSNVTHQPRSDTAEAQSDTPGLEAPCSSGAVRRRWVCSAAPGSRHRHTSPIGPVGGLRHAHVPVGRADCAASEADLLIVKKQSHTHTLAHIALTGPVLHVAWGGYSRFLCANRECEHLPPLPTITTSTAHLPPQAPPPPPLTHPRTRIYFLISLIFLLYGHALLILPCLFTPDVSTCKAGPPLSS